jgi:transcriptional regulator with XRE-family HTH domain
LTQERLAERLGVTQNSVWYWQHDQNNPRDPEHMIELLRLSDPGFTPRDQRVLIDRERFTANEGGQWTEPSVSWSKDKP